MTSATPKPRAGEHTKGPWRIGYSDGSGSGENGEGIYIVAPNAYPVVRGGMDDWNIPKGIELEADARRIVACVNACEGIATTFLEHEVESGNPLTMIAELASLRERERELKKLLQECLDMSDNWPGVAYSYDLESRAKAALAND
jgi:hypothetical protein